MLYNGQVGVCVCERELCLTLPVVPPLFDTFVYIYIYIFIVVENLNYGYLVDLKKKTSHYIQKFGDPLDTFRRLFAF